MMEGSHVPRTISSKALALGVAALVAGCGEWSGVLLHKPETRQEAVCIKDRGWRLPPEQIERLRQCIEICEAQGFRLEDPADRPAPTGAPRLSQPWIPNACRPAAAASAAP